MESISDYKKWLQGLGDEERDKYEFLTDLALWHGSIRAGQLREQYNMRFVSNNRKNLKAFAEGELVRASDDLTRISFPCDWHFINQEIAGVRERLQWRKSEDPIIVTEEMLEGDLVVLDNDEDELLLMVGDEYWNNVDIDYDILFKHLMYDSHHSNLEIGGLSREYLKYDFSDADHTDFDYSHLRDFDKVVELIGRLRWLFELMNIVEGENYDKQAADKTIPRRTLADIVIQYIWEGRLITTDNKDEIAAEITKAGILSLKNGNKLYNKHCDYIKNCTRTGDLGDDKKNRNHYQVLLRAYKNLKNKEHQQVAEKEISTFKNNAFRNSGTKF